MRKGGVPLRLRAARLLFPVAALAFATFAAGGTAQAQSVTTYHGSPDRAGNFVAPGLGWERARHVRLDPAFAPRFSGHVYAQPLYWQPPGASGELIIATETDSVVAIEARSGAVLWARALARPVPSASHPCGNIDPLGITGTPVIDAHSGTLYLDAMAATPAGPRHLIFALSLTDGRVLPGWPVDAAAALAARGERFNAADQNQRGALTILADRVYVPYGGHFGDCGDYRGWVIGVALGNPADIVAWHTRGRGGGIWAPAGIASDGRSVYFATGNTLAATRWSDGEAVFRLQPNLARLDRPQDFFAVADWRALDERDADLGGVAPLPLRVRAPGGAEQDVVLALGKDRRAYLLDAANLGGIGGALTAETVSRRPIRTAAAAFPTAEGADVAFQGPGEQCRAAAASGLTVLEIHTGSPPRLKTAWCQALDGAGSPVVTTTDGRAEPIVWILGAEGDNRLHAFRGDTGEPLSDGGGATLAGLHHFQDLLPAGGRLFIGADDRLYAFDY